MNQRTGMSAIDTLTNPLLMAKKLDSLGRFGADLYHLARHFVAHDCAERVRLLAQNPGWVARSTSRIESKEMGSTAQ